MEARINGWRAEGSNVLYPGLDDFLERSSPRTHMAHLRAPLFLFHATDDDKVPIATATRFAHDLQGLGKSVTFQQATGGGHYQSMVREGIPAAIAWLGSHRAER